MSKLLQLRNDKPFQIRNKANDSAEIILYAAIGSFWGDSISANDFSKELKALPDTVKNIDVRINSPGGDVFDGISIYNRLKQHKAKKTVYIDGMAYSIASIIALAGDEIVMGEGTEFMIHLPWTWAGGNKNELMDTVNRLEDIEDQMVNIYHKRTKLDKAEIRNLMTKETFMNPEEAISLGFADKTMDSEKALMVAASVEKAFWIRGRPKSLATNTEIVKNKLKTLSKDIGKILDRK